MSDALIKRFVAGECDSEEEQLVLEYLRNHPSFLETFLNEHPVLMEDRYSAPLDEQQSNEMLRGVYSGIFQRRRSRIIRLKWISAAIAASVLLFVFFLKEDKGVPDSTPSQSIAIARVTRTNTTAEMQQWTLPDSSQVDAMPGASITYLPHFTRQKREVFLRGEASFTAHHDPSRSFVVICDGTSTTALGTTFKVRSEAGTVTVILYEGKVIVRAKGQNEGSNFCYLNPGMSTVFYKKEHRFITTSNFVKRPLVRKSKKIITGAPEKRSESPVITLENLRMQDALDQLALIYNVEIQYAPVDIQHMNIIASIPKTQSIGSVLQNLATANGLEMKKIRDSVYLIQKNK